MREVTNVVFATQYIGGQHLYVVFVVRVNDYSDYVVLVEEEICMVIAVIIALFLVTSHYSSGLLSSPSYEWRKVYQREKRKK